MKEPDITAAIEQKELILEITNTILLEAKSQEVIFANDFVDRYINALATGKVKISSHSNEDVPLGLGGGEVILTSLILPIIVNVISYAIKKTLDRSKAIGEAEKILSSKMKDKRLAKKLAKEIIDKISERF